MCGMWGNVKAVTFIVVAVSTVCGLQMRFQAASYAGCISHHEARKILSHKTAALQAPVLKTLSVDLGCTEQPIVLNKDGLHSCGEKMLASWDEIDEIMKKTAGCYALYDDGSKPWQISAMSEKTHFSASLCPPLTRAGAPTMVLGGFTMHRIAGDNVDPMTDTVNKIGAIKPFITPHSRILDTCMGLGYTATSAARLLSGTGRLTTIEYDDVSVEMCKYNPWSKGLFDESLPIDTHMGDSCEIVTTFPDQSFDCVVHDPPARAICKTNLYGLAFYQQLLRVLRHPGGALFHYIGNPSSKESGGLYRGIKTRLLEAGFSKVYTVDSAFGLVAEC